MSLSILFNLIFLPSKASFTIDYVSSLTQHQLRHLIDLKQKQANFSEAISARELARQTAENTELQIKQAQETTRQGKTLMVFTVVTIIFVRVTNIRKTEVY